MASTGPWLEECDIERQRETEETWAKPVTTHWPGDVCPVWAVPVNTRG